MPTQKVKHSDKTVATAKVEAPAIEAVSSPLSPAETTRAKRVAALEKARAAKRAKATKVKRQANAAKARAARATKAKRAAALEKARAAKARLAEFEVRSVPKKALVAFVEDSGLKKDLLAYLDNTQEAEEAEQAA